MPQKVVKMTPEWAKRLLDHNSVNRKVKPRWVNELARRMIDGEWQYNGHAILISSAGTLLDGQHRLLALIQAGVTLDMLVVTELPPECFITIDVGQKRSFSDVLGIEGHRNCTLLAAACRLVWKYENGSLGGDESVAPSYEALSRVLEEHPGIATATSILCGSDSLKALGSGASLTFTVYAIFHYCTSDISERWCNQMRGDTPTSRRDITYHLRERLINNRRAKARLRTTEVLAICIKAANIFVAGKQCGVLRWSKEANEPFPRFDFWK